MRSEDFTSDMSGRLVKAPEGHLAFVPDPLPPAIPWDDLLVTRLTEAVETVASLDQAARRLASPFLVSGISNSFLMKEAQLSARIEGTQTTLAELYRAELFPEPGKPDVNEVSNHINALVYGLKRQAEIPLCKRLLLELHSIMMQKVQGARGANSAVGEFRRISNHIGQPGGTVEEATFVPPPPLEMMDALNQLEVYINDETQLNVLVRAALVHAQFEVIHPFEDGNGRIGRLIIILMLCTEGTLSSPLIYLSAFFDRTRDEYCRRLLEVSTHGDWHSWLIYFLAGVRDQGKDALRRCQVLEELHGKYTGLFQRSGRSALTLKLVDNLFQSPFFSTNVAAEFLAVEYHNAQRHINKLVSAGVLVEITGQSRNRVYCAHEIMAAIEAE